MILPCDDHRWPVQAFVRAETIEMNRKDFLAANGEDGFVWTIIEKTRSIYTIKPTAEKKKNCLKGIASVTGSIGALETKTAV